MKVQVSGVINNSFVNGEGIRVVIFLSGCYFNCPECHNKDIQDPNYGNSMEIDEVMDIIKNNIPIIDGITLSGGEPTLQWEQSLEIIKRSKELGLNVWMYTGDVYENLIKDSNKRQLIENADIIVDGRFEKDKVSNELIYRGSSNQRIIDCKKSIESNSIVLWNENLEL